MDNKENMAKYAMINQRVLKNMNFPGRIFVYNGDPDF
jgi:hypothetical protein